MADAGSRLLFKFRPGTHGLNEELGRHRGREGNKECVLCGNEWESVSHYTRHLSVSRERCGYAARLACAHEAPQLLRNMHKYGTNVLHR